jgi:hypothetical protein
MKGFRIRGLLAMVAVALAAGTSCGGDEDTAGAFIGAWKYTSGTSTTNCGGSSETDQLQGTVTINKGVSSPLVMIDGACTLAMDVNGNTATARIPQECNRTEGGVNYNIKFNAYTFTVSGVVADDSGSATVQLSGAGGSVNCNYTQSAKLMKVSQ